MITYQKTTKDKIYYEDPEMDVLHRLIEYADRNVSFTDHFFLTCEMMAARDGYLSGRQVNHLIEIYEKNCASTVE